MAETLDLPHIGLRGRSFMALVLAPDYPMTDWFAAFDRQLQAGGEFFAARPVVADLSATLKGGGPDAVEIVLDGLEARNLRLIGIEGVDADQLAGTRWERLTKTLHGREAAIQAKADARAAPQADQPPPPEAAPAAPSLLIDKPVRSGQSIVFPDGDITIVGSVSSGAEVIAGGSVHIYGALRGRAIAGLKTGAAARIFCRKLQAEMVGVDQLYRTAEHWGAALHGRPVQVLCDRGALRLSALD
jgi:septum site-determining protein MinC